MEQVSPVFDLTRNSRMLFKMVLFAAALAAQQAEAAKNTSIEDDYIMTKPPDLNVVHPSASLEEDEEIMKVNIE